MLDDINLFIHVAEAGSLKQASEQLSIPLPTLSRKMSKLESGLGCLLFHRSTIGLSLTKEGEIYYQNCVWHIQALKNTLSDLDRSLNSLSGNLTVLAPTNFALTPLEEFWKLFIQKYPQIRLRVELSNRLSDFKTTQADLAIRIGELPDSSLIQTKLGSFNMILVASAKQATHNLPESIEDLKKITTITTTYVQEWVLTDSRQNSRVLHKQHDYLVDDVQLAVILAKSGAGVALVPISQVINLLHTGELIPILPDYKGPERTISIIRPSRNYYSIRAKTFHDELTAFIRKQSWIHTNEKRN